MPLACGGVLVSRMASVTLAVLVGLAPIAPPEHVHEFTDAHGHHQLIAHRHAELHTGIPEHHDGSTIDHDDGSVEIEAVYVRTAAYTLTAPAEPASSTEVIATAVTPRTPAPFVEPLIHAPPRAPASLRAPPRPSSC